VQYLRLGFLCRSQDALPKIEDFFDLSLSNDDAPFHQQECSDSYKKSQSKDLSQSVGTSNANTSPECYFNVHLLNGFSYFYKPLREDEYEKLFAETYMPVVEWQDWKEFSKIDQKEYLTFSSCYKKYLYNYYVYSIRHYKEVKYFQANVEMYLAFLECIYIFHHIIEKKNLAWEKDDANIYNFSPLEERLYKILFKSNNDKTPYTFYKTNSKIRILAEIKNIDYANRKAIYISEFNYLYERLILQFQKFYDSYKDREDLVYYERNTIDGLARHLLNNLENWYGALAKKCNLLSDLNVGLTNFYISGLQENKSILVSQD